MGPLGGRWRHIRSDGRFHNSRQSVRKVLGTRIQKQPHPHPPADEALDDRNEDARKQMEEQLEALVDEPLEAAEKLEVSEVSEPGCGERPIA